jgi:hypothetical protein
MGNTDDLRYTGADETQAPGPADSIGRPQEDRTGFGRGPEGCDRQAEAGAEEARLKTGFKGLDSVFRFVHQSNQALNDGPSEHLTRPLVELYREGYVCLLIDFDFRPIGSGESCELTAVFYRDRLTVKLDRDFARPVDPHMHDVNAEGRRYDHSMLVRDCEIVEGAEVVTVPAKVWLYRRLQYSDEFRGKRWFFRSATNGLLKSIKRLSGREVNADIRQARVPHENAHGQVERVPKIVNNVPDDWRKLVVAKDVFTPRNPNDCTGLQVEVRDGLISLQLHKALQEVAKFSDMSFGPLYL